jgi:hypothetical protein
LSLTQISAILNFIKNISNFSDLLPLVFFLLFKLKSKEKTLRVIFFYLLYSLVSEIVLYFYHTRYFAHTMYAFFTILEFSCFCLFYYFAVSTTIVRKGLLPLWSLFFIFALVDFFQINKQSSFDSINTGIESIFIILMCIYYLVVQIRGVNDLFVYSTSNFWIVITFLILTSGTFFLYIMAENNYDNKIFQLQYDIINTIFNILKNILFSTAMLMKPTPTDKVQKDKKWSEPLFYKLKK